MVILKATSFLKGHKRDIGMTCSITHKRAISFLGSTNSSYSKFNFLFKYKETF